MSKPELYIKHSFLAQADADFVLIKNKALFNYENYHVLDVGCGPGNVTYEKVVPLLPKTTTKLIGVDVSSDNIKYAKKHYEMDHRVSFHQMDILTDRIPTDYLGKFDLIISLYCFHFVGDHRKALMNIYKMLRPGGRILISFMGKSEVAATYESLRENPKWTKYMQNFDKIVPIPQSKPTCMSLCKEVGFNKIKCQEEPKDFPHAEDMLLSMFKSLNLFNVPTNLEEDFVKDHLDHFRKEGYLMVDPDGNKKFNFPHTVLIITATK